MKTLVIMDNVGPFKRNNHLVLTNALFEAGEQVHIGQVNTIGLDRGRVTIDAVELKAPLAVGDRLSESTRIFCAERFDLVWVLNQPHHSIEKDVFQLLWLLSSNVQFVNSMEGMLFLNNKNGIQAVVPQEHMIEGHCSNRFEDLWQTFKDSGDRQWVAKPTNDGCGADVFIVRKDDTNSRAILQSMTGNAAMRHEMYNPESYGFSRRYCLLQKYVPHTIGSEKRVMFAGDELLGSYVKLFAAGEHRPNLAHGGRCELCDLTADEENLSRLIHSRLLARGVNFGAFDFAYPFVFEFNLVNPGGVQTFTQLTGKDHAIIAARNILKRARAK